MSHHCDDHALDFRGEECPLHMAFQHFVHALRDKYIVYDPSWDSFNDWWHLEGNTAARMANELLLISDPAAVFRDWAWDALPECMRLTVAVVVCQKCSRHIRTDMWRGKDAHRGDQATITHGLCDACDREAEDAA